MPQASGEVTSPRSPTSRLSLSPRLLIAAGLRPGPSATTPEEGGVLLDPSPGSISLSVRAADRGNAGIQEDTAPAPFDDKYNGGGGVPGDAHRGVDEDGHPPASVTSASWSRGLQRRLGRATKWVGSPKPWLPWWLQRGLFLGVTLVASWMSAWLILKDKAAPNGEIFALAAIWVFAVILGEVVRPITHPLLGGIIAGFVMRYVPGVRGHENIPVDTRANVRFIALLLILMRAGLSLDLKLVKKLPILTLASATGPLLVEVMLVVWVGRHFFLFSMRWALMTAFLVGAVSPAVIVAVVLQLSSEGYGLAKGIPSFIVVTGTLTNVLAVVGFSIIKNSIFNSDSVVLLILRAPIEIVVGLVSGLLFGCTAVFLVPNTSPVTGVESPRVRAALKKARMEDSNSEMYMRLVLMLALCFVLGYGLRTFSYDGAAVLAVVVHGTTVTHLWGPQRMSGVALVLGRLWDYVAQPLLFAIIGVRISPSSFHGSFFWRALVTLVPAACLRLLATWSILTVMPRTSLTPGESLFCACSWFPKATVQATLAPVALVAAQSRGVQVEDELVWGQATFNLAVISILLAAPLGASIMLLIGPRLLTKDTPAPPSTDEEHS